MNRYDFFALALICVASLLSLGVYDQLPDPLPTHWTLNGKADGFTPLPWGAFIIPLITAVTYGVLRMLPAISPREFPVANGPLQKVALATVVFLVLVHISLLHSAITGEINLSWLPIGLGLLFAVIGNYLNKTQPNFFFGIRTPWTIAHPEVWARTHRIGGWGFILAGMSSVVAGFILHPAYAIGIMAALVTVVALTTVVYSYVLYRRFQPQT